MGQDIRVAVKSPTSCYHLFISNEATKKCYPITASDIYHASVMKKESIHHEPGASKPGKNQGFHIQKPCFLPGNIRIFDGLWGPWKDP